MKELALHGWRPERGVQHSLSKCLGARHLPAAQRRGRGEMGVATHAVEQSVKMERGDGRNVEPGEVIPDRGQA